MRLLELFKDIQLEVKGAGQFGRYPQSFKVEKNPRFHEVGETAQIIAHLERKRRERLVSGLSLDPQDTYMSWKLRSEIEKEGLTLEKLREHVARLNQKYPDRGFRLKRVGKYHVLDQSTKTEEGKRVRDRIPIYFDLEAQSFHVPAYYWKTKPKLVRFIAMVTLGSLGVSQSKYVR